MASLGSTKGSAEKLSLPLMIVAFLSVAGFLYWLSISAQSSEVALQEETAAEEALSTMDFSAFLVSPAQYVGQKLRLTRARVSSPLGPHAFWAGPDDRPFLVKMGPELLATAPQVLPEQILDLEGTVLVLSDSMIAAWAAEGAFPSQGDRIVAEFALGSPILEASSLRVSRPTGGVGGPGEGGGKD